MEVIVLVGLQAAGKSTFYRTYYAATHILVSKDLFPNNRRPQRRQMQLIREALEVGRSVVVDNTNPSADDRSPIVELARSLGAAVVGVYFESRLSACLERNEQRAGRKRVPDGALYSTASRLTKPAMTEGFDRLFCITIDPNGGFLIKEWEDNTFDEDLEPRETNADG